MAAESSVRSGNFEYLDALLVQVAGKPGPVGAGSFDTDLAEFPLSSASM
nr:hypothetical protein [Mycobacterium attenuatum]